MVDLKALHQFCLPLHFPNKIWTRHIIATHDTNKKRKPQCLSAQPWQCWGGGVHVFLKEKKEVTIFGNNWAARLLANASKASW